MYILIGLLIIAVGSFGQSSSYVPIKKVKNWAWECFWLTQGIFAWLLFPFLGALLAVPENNSLFGIIGNAGSSAVLQSIAFGALWGIGGLTFGLSMRYLGVALGQSLSLGICSAFGTLIPPLLPQLFPDAGKITPVLIIGVSIAIAGIAIIGYAGALKSQAMSEEEKRKAVKDFALKKGLLIALLAGVMSACFNLGLNAGAPIKELLLSISLQNINDIDVMTIVQKYLHNEPIDIKLKNILDHTSLYASLPTTLLVTIGGFVTNAIYCIYQNVKNNTGKQYFSVSRNIFVNNILFCSLAGILWYSQFFGLGVGQSFLKASPIMLAFSWSILMSLNVLFSNVWGIFLKEWKGSGQKTIIVLLIGLAMLVASIVFPQIIK
ncbi:MAG: L-rhamnose/proton symporter RhaT [Prevotellaceae bacterium]|jgi:L-rhamnose-H+ transport protein|nr:L-rhamnose/proton symporter RhaT [Prevotellaceae bacterium]